MADQIAVCVFRSRCTGYRPILDAFRVFAKGDSAAYTEEAIAASKAGVSNGHAHSKGASNGHAHNTNGACENGPDGCNGKSNGHKVEASDSNGRSNGQKTNGKVSPPDLPVVRARGYGSIRAFWGAGRSCTVPLLSIALESHFCASE